jgi:hypothetical protein
MYQLTFHVPASHLEQVKNALFAAGAGQYNGYDRCAWQTLGEGQFRPLAGSDPYLGEVGQLERIAEYKVEMIVEDNCIKPVAAALLSAHPYQQPAYGFNKILTAAEL